MTRVLHLLPHRGGGAETYLDLLERLDGIAHLRRPLADARTPLAAGPSILRRWPGAARAAGRADVVHAHGDVAAALTLPLLRARPSVWTTHGLHALRRAEGPAGAAMAAAARAAVAATAVTLCCSTAERDELAALVRPDLHDRLRVVPNGVDPALPTTAAARAAARGALDLREDERVALFLGELEERKGPLTAARGALAAGVTLLVAGDGPQRAELEALAAAADGARRPVRVLGFRRDVDTLLAAADLFVLPSEREGISFAVLEAMAHGLAMVVSDGAGNPEAVGEAGVVVGVRDEAGWARALAAAPATLGPAARERVQAVFPVSRLLDGVAAAYREATSASAGPLG